MLKFKNMVYKRLFWNILIRTILLTINAVVLGLLLVFLDKEDYVTISLVGALLLVQVVFFVIGLNRINRDLEIFFDSVYALDSSISFKDSLVSRHFTGLYDKLMKVNSIVGGLRINLEEQNEYYKKIANQMPTSIVSFYEEGSVVLINAAAKNLFGVRSINNISDLDTINSELVKYLMEHEETDQQLIKSRMNGEIVSLMVKLSSASIGKKKVRIASIQNIEQELGNKEIESWQSLLKVLTHEIANSIAPISSTVDTLNEIPIEGDARDHIDKMKAGLDIIGERNQGLLKLLEDIRKFSSFPSPERAVFDVGELFSSCYELFKEELSRENVELELEMPSPKLALNADKQLITHVLINLITNAKEAMQGGENKKITLRSNIDELGFIYIRIIDNGPGISEEKLDQIMVPFFTTKQSGSGIGLSLSREIMRQHGGSLLVSSEPGHTEFCLKFKTHE